MTAIPVLARLFFIAIGVALLTAGVVITVRKRHEGWVGLRAGAFLMATALVLGLSFNSVAKNDYQKKDNTETATVKVLNWYTGENQEARTAVEHWLVEFVTD